MTIALLHQEQKNTFSCGNYRILTFFSCCLLESRTKDHTHGPLGPSSTVAFFSNYKQNTKFWNLKLHYYRKEHKSYLQGYFSSLQFDSGKKFIQLRTKDQILYGRHQSTLTSNDAKQREHRLRSEFAFRSFSLSIIPTHLPFVKCRRTLLKLNSKGQQSSSERERKFCRC